MGDEFAQIHSYSNEALLVSNSKPSERTWEYSLQNKAYSNDTNLSKPFMQRSSWISDNNISVLHFVTPELPRDLCSAEILIREYDMREHQQHLRELT